MLVNEKRLQWWGMDMRPRWRRRVAVSAGYCGFVGLMSMWSIERLLAHPWLAGFLLMIACYGWRYWSVFRIVRNFEDIPSNQKTMRVNGLDEWARYRYGVASFEEADEEQKADLLRRYRVGTYVVPAKGAASTELTVRETKERSEAERWTLRQLAFFFSFEMFSCLRLAARHQTMDPIEAAMGLWAFWLLVWTLPAARILWIDPDPRGRDMKMELAQVESQG